ncbi:MAG: hypothetical protein KatS3mg092_0214 [Patescibacteria group bacterium]|nr:MAG: hypothetical protein KatS3mg092_0214 [Patescibacteria group bacterium]
MIDSGPSLAELGVHQSKVQPIDLQDYSKKEASLRKLPDTRIIKEGDEEFLEFSFSNGFKVITNTFEESVKFSKEGDSQNKYFRVRKFLVNFQGRDVDLLDNETARICDHFISFRVSTIGSHFNRQVVVVNNENQEIERYKSNVVIYVPINKERTDYDAEEMLYEWVHELGHAIDLIDSKRKFRKVSAEEEKYELVSNEKLNGVKAERNAHAIGLKILKGIKRLYGPHQSISEERYVNNVVEPSLHSRQFVSMDFRSAYSNQDRALFRDEEIEIRKNGITEEADREIFQTKFRRDKNISTLSARLGENAAKIYDSLVKAWVDENIEKMEKLNRIFAKDGLDKPKTREELVRELELEYHSAILRKYGIPWEQFSSLLK